MPQPLTKQQRAIYAFIADHIRQLGYAPTYAEMCRHFEVRSLSTMHKHVSVLVEKGFLIPGEWNRARAIELAPAASHARPAPPAVVEALRALRDHVDADMSGYWTERTSNLMQQADAALATAGEVDRG